MSRTVDPPVLVTAGRGEVDLLGAVRRTVPAFLDLRNVFATIAIVTERVDPPSNPASKPHADTLETSRLLVELVHAVYATRAAEAETAAGVGGQDGSSTDGGVGTGSLHGSARAHSAPSAGGVPVRREAPSTHAIRAAFHVYQHGQRTIGQLADGLGISYGWASRVVTELEAGGLVERRADVPLAGRGDPTSAGRVEPGATGGRSRVPAPGDRGAGAGGARASRLIRRSPDPGSVAAGRRCDEPAGRGCPPVRVPVSSVRRGEGSRTDVCVVGASLGPASLIREVPNGPSLWDATGQTAHVECVLGPPTASTHRAGGADRPPPPCAGSMDHGTSGIASLLPSRPWTS
jgi:hypothetical protein